MGICILATLLSDTYDRRPLAGEGGEMRVRRDGASSDLRRYSCCPHSTVCLVLPSPCLVFLPRSLVPQQQKQDIRFARNPCLFPQSYVLIRCTPGEGHLVQLVALCLQTTPYGSPSSTMGTWWGRPRCRAWTAASWPSPSSPGAAWSRWSFPSLARKNPPSVC